MLIEITEIDREALPSLSERLRGADATEVFLLTGKSNLEAITDSLETSEETYFGYIDGNPEAVFGVAKMSNTVGIPWMLGTDALAKAARHWLPLVMPMVEQWHQRYQVLTNLVHRENFKSIRWLQHMGFVFLDRPIPSRPDFIQFVRYR